MWTDWSKFDEIDIKLPDGTHKVESQKYENTLTLRVGAEYKFQSVGAAVRAGYIYDPTPVPTTTISARLPDINRHVVTVGGSYSFSELLDAHLGLLWVLPGTSTASNVMPYEPVFKGSYDVSAFVASVSLIAHLGK